MIKDFCVGFLAIIGMLLFIPIGLFVLPFILISAIGWIIRDERKW